MKRRRFIRNTALGGTLPFWLQQCQTKSSPDFPISFHSDQQTGHLVFESFNWPTGVQQSFERVIVGGGVAGLAAAYQSTDRDFALFELSDRLGGTSASGKFHGLNFCQGAHYDLDYPDYYGEEALLLLEELGVIHYQDWKKAWSFNDQQHIIPHRRRQQCFEAGQLREDVIPEGATKTQFLEILTAFLGQMHLPTRLIPTELHHLNDLTFLEFLQSEMEVTPAFERQLDYHMMDDYGGVTNQVSALAGIHYFMCRPYYLKPVSLFSPPQGNDYFVERMAHALPVDRIHLQHLVRRIEEDGTGFQMEVADIAQRRVHVVRAQEIIYAGQKHALEHIFPSEYKLFTDNVYAPWMVVNVVARQAAKDYGFWQNEFLGEEKSFLGFIDSSVQDQASLDGKRVFTAYYCLKPEDREYLSTIADNQERIVSDTFHNIQKVLPNVREVEGAFVKVMGHAMPIPVPGYLFRDANDENPRLRYAGVDNGRLPLLFEALDSGLQASGLS